MRRSGQSTVPLWLAGNSERVRPQILKGHRSRLHFGDGGDISLWTPNTLGTNEGGGKSCLEAIWLPRSLYIFHPHRASKCGRVTSGQYLALAVPFGRWRLPHSFQDEKVLPFPPRQCQREGSLPAKMGRQRSGSPRTERPPQATNSPSVALNLLPPREVGLLPQQFKAPTDSRQPHPPRVAERGRPGGGGGGTKATS